MEESFYENFPSYEESVKIIEELKKCKWDEYNIEDYSSIKEFKSKVFSQIDNAFKFYTHLIQQFKCDEFKLGLFRVRDLSTFTNVDIFSEHSYPPIKITKMGRCNFPETPVFYCSNDPGTSLMEVIRNNEFKNVRFCISRWKVKPSDDILFLESFLRNSLPKENLFKDFNKSLAERLDKTFGGNLSLNKRKSLAKYFEFLDDVFISDSSYSLSASIAHNALFREHEARTDVIMYPSKQSKLRGVNFAINPNFVSNNMFVDRFYVVEVNDISASKYNISFRKYGTALNRAILWRDITEKDELFENFVIEDFGQSFYENIKP